MKKTKPENAAKPWIVINISRQSRFECLRCGRFYAPALPVEVWAWNAVMDGFAKKHSSCKLGPKGLHCLNCGGLGHSPTECKTLDALTPEQWLNGPDTGTSSKTIYSVLYRQVFGPDMGSPHCIPYDPDDFGRCYRLLQRFPEWRSRLGEVANKYPLWLPFVTHWDELTDLYEEEIPKHYGPAPKLYNRMLQLRGA
jgi:hypothetical protein